MKQARRDLEHARESVRLAHYEWACFSAQQAAETAVKAVFERQHGEAWGHSVSRLMRALSEWRPVPDHLTEKAAFLDQHYILTRYPNGFDQGAPMEFYSQTQANQVVEYAQEIIEFCASEMP